MPENDFAPEWALDNVYIGMGCPDHCSGHGGCSDLMVCQCDHGYHGNTCSSNIPRDRYFKDSFTLQNKLDIGPVRGDTPLIFMPSKYILY